MSEMYTTQGSGSSPLCVPGVRPSASRQPPTPHSYPAPPPRSPLPTTSKQLTPPRRAQLATASPAPPLPSPCPSQPLPLPLPLPPPAPVLPLARAALARGPRERERRVSEERYKRPRDAAKVPAAESSPGRAAAAEEEENAEAGRTSDALTAASPPPPARAASCSRRLLLVPRLPGHPRPRDGNGAGADPAGQGDDEPEAQSEAGEAVRAGQRAGLLRRGDRPGGDSVQPLYGRQPPAGRGGSGGRAAGRAGARAGAEGPGDSGLAKERQAAGGRPLQPGTLKPAARLLGPPGAGRGRRQIT